MSASPLEGVTMIRVHVPRAFPEVVALLAGQRLYTTAEDTVPTLIRLGSDITGYLTAGEIAAMLELGTPTFERWLRYGWDVEAAAEADL